MPGAYTHMTLVNFASAPVRLDQVEGFPLGAKRALGRYLKYCELGVVSPDYPYLDLASSDSKGWADAMHFRTTDQVIKAAIARLITMNGAAKEKGLAWLLGYAAHVTMDVTLHPVINLKVGDYETHKREHRVCEMNQDVHIYQRLGLGSTRLSEHLDSGIASCRSEDGGLDPDIRDLWGHALATAYPAEFAAAAPQFDAWHRRFKFMVDKIADEGQWLQALSRHVLGADLGVTYPAPEDLDPQFIKGLETPAGRRMDFDDLFDMATDNVTRVWTWVARGVLDGDVSYLTEIGDWNLDTGKDRAGRTVFWS